MVVNSPVSGGRAEIGGNSSVEFPGGSRAAVSFDGGAAPSTAGMLKLDLSPAGAFDGTIGRVQRVRQDRPGRYRRRPGNGRLRGQWHGHRRHLDRQRPNAYCELRPVGRYAAAGYFATAADEHGGTLLTLSDPSENHLLAPGT
jgi:hypothetical protein